MAATNILNFSLDQGSSLDVIISVTDQADQIVNLTGYDARVQVRQTYGGSAKVNGTLANGKLVLTNAAGGILTWKISPADTSSITWPNATDETQDLVYDVEVISPTSAVYKPVRGVITLNREVTR